MSTRLTTLRALAQGMSIQSADSRMLLPLAHTVSGCCLLTGFCLASAPFKELPSPSLAALHCCTVCRREQQSTGHLLTLSNLPAVALKMLMAMVLQALPVSLHRND